MPPPLIDPNDLPIPPSPPTTADFLRAVAADGTGRSATALPPQRIGNTGWLPVREEPGRSAFLEAAAPIREWIYRDAFAKPEELEPLLRAVAFWLGDPRLSAAPARRFALAEDPRILRRFRRAAGISLSEYIRRRQAELATSMILHSGLGLPEIAEILGFAREEALAGAVELWSRVSLERVRESNADRRG